jgi:predicted trehalose synthase
MSKDRDSREDQNLGEKMKAGEPLMERAMQALRRYHEAQETQPEEEVEKLRLEAEALFTAVHEYQRQALGGSSLRLH